MNTKFSLVMADNDGALGVANFEADVTWLAMDPKHIPKMRSFRSGSLCQLSMSTADGRFMRYIPPSLEGWPFWDRLKWTLLGRI